MTNERVEVRQDPARLRPLGVKVLQADSSKFRVLTGWAPRIPFERTMRDLMEWCRRGLEPQRVVAGLECAP